MINRSELQDYLENELFKKSDFEIYLAASALSTLAGEAVIPPDGATFNLMKERHLMPALQDIAREMLNRISEEQLPIAEWVLEWLAALTEEMQRHAVISGISYGLCIAGPGLEMLNATGRRQSSLFQALVPRSKGAAV